MIYFLQILKMLKQNERQDAVSVFSDLSHELEDMGWSDDPEGLVEGILFNHFGLRVEDPRQLEMLSKFIVKAQSDPKLLESALSFVSVRSQS